MSIEIMRRMGVLDRVLAAGAWRLDYVRIDGPGGESARLRFVDYMQPDTYALVLPRITFDDVLRQHALAAGAAFLGDRRVTHIERVGDRITAVQADGPGGPVSFHPRHVILAVGANMGLLKREGFLKHEPQLVRASRAYYEGTGGITDSYTFFYDRELLPGYGWVFPTGDGSANIGVGTMPSIWGNNHPPTTQLLERFIQRRIEDGTLPGAHRVTPVKGYPLRIDFRRQQVAGENWVITGESAGLVNPVTGEGIDMALESGLIAGEAIHEGLMNGPGYAALYTRRLRRRFLWLFRGLHAVREALINPLMVPQFVRQMNTHHFLGKAVIEIALGMVPPRIAFSPKFIIQLFSPVAVGGRPTTPQLEKR